MVIMLTCSLELYNIAYTLLLYIDMPYLVIIKS